MWQELAKATTVLLSSALKFILGPVEGFTFQLHPLITWLATVTGMMLSVVVFTYFGGWIRKRVLKRFNKNEKPASSNRRFSGLIEKYGLGGVAFLTPILLTPIGGTIIAVSMGKPKEKILLFMLISAMSWGTALTAAVYAFGKMIMNWLPDLLR
jgi:membrane protein DedA with SNARE-associated domain